jgi:hypothetical protein
MEVQTRISWDPVPPEHCQVRSSMSLSAWSRSPLPRRQQPQFLYPNNHPYLIQAQDQQLEPCSISTNDSRCDRSYMDCSTWSSEKHLHSSFFFPFIPPSISGGLGHSAQVPQVDRWDQRYAWHSPKDALHPPVIVEHHAEWNYDTFEVAESGQVRLRRSRSTSDLKVPWCQWSNGRTNLILKN